MAIERQGFEGAYISGAALSADLGLSDIGLTTLDEVAGRGAAIARRTALPAIIDTDTGFGEALNVARTVQTRWKRRGCAAVTSRTSRIRNAATTWTANHSCPPPTAGNCTWCAAPNRTAT